MSLMKWEISKDKIYCNEILFEFFIIILNIQFILRISELLNRYETLFS